MADWQQSLNVSGGHTFEPVLPPTSVRKEIIRPFLPSFNLTPVATSTMPALIFSFSSSLPHSIPLCTRAQWVLCKSSSSKAPLVYDKSHKGQVRKTEVSREKWSCVSGFPFCGDARGSRSAWFTEPVHHFGVCFSNGRRLCV